MADSSIHRVFVYHDETKNAGSKHFKGHVLLFMPINIVNRYSTDLFTMNDTQYCPEKHFRKNLLELRKRYSLDKKFHFSDISGTRWTRYDLGLREVMYSASEALRHKSSGLFSQSLCCKLAIIFYPKGGNLSIYGGKTRKEKGQRHDETMLRILLKGAVHYLYNEANKVIISGIFSDGIPGHRKLDVDRVVRRLMAQEAHGRTALREYAQFTQDASIIHLQSDHKQYAESNAEYLHANYLQIADLLLGAVIHSCHVGCSDKPIPPKIGEKVKSKRDIIAYPIKLVLDKRRRGRGFINSGHYRAFSITQIIFNDGDIIFKQLNTAERKSISTDLLAALR